LEKNFNKKLMFTTTLCVLLSAFTSGGRGIVLTFGLTILMAYMIQSKQVKIQFATKLKLLAFLVIVICLLVYITTARGTSVNFSALMHTVVLYFTAPYIYFEKLLKYALQERVMLFGGAFFGGILDFFILTFKFFSGSDVLTMAQHIATYNQTYIYVGVNSQYNAFPTMVYTFLYDFSYLGVILGPLLFGAIAMSSYKRMISTNRIAYKGIYIMIALLIYQSVMKWEGTSAYPWIVLAMFLIYEFLRKKGLAQLSGLIAGMQRHINIRKKGISS
jgi:oligosaccharide repeat unit polymerase